ncbi:MAG TPA: hypothetical protein VN802_22125 [Stellaceae bacterium]|nr:hypothetical protein [Stellaceae bacterium]
MKRGEVPDSLGKIAAALLALIVAVVLFVPATAWSPKAGKQNQSGNRNQQPAAQISTLDQNQSTRQAKTNSGDNQKKEGDGRQPSPPPQQPPDYTPWLVLMTGFLAAAAFWQGAIARDVARRQLRAYVTGAPLFTFAFDEKTRPAVRVSLTNSGQTPAHHLRERYKVDLLSHPPGPGMNLPIITSEFSAPMVLHPKGEPFFFRAICDRDFTEEEISRIRDGSARIYIYGELIYCDAFNTERHTRFFYSITADAETLRKLTSSYAKEDLFIRYEIAQIGNDAD